MSELTVEYLADYPEHIDACAAWDYGFWEIGNKDTSLDDMINTYREGAQKDGLPLTLICIDNSKNLPVGMTSLWKSDGAQWAEKTPWVASVFVHNYYRGKGIAKALLERAEQEAKRLGIELIYLKADTVAEMYEPLGYSKIDTMPYPEGPTGEKILFKKDLT